VKPLYITGTQRDVGKTTISLGLLHAFRHKGLRVGYIKPLGQRVKKADGRTRHDDAEVVAGLMGMTETLSADMAVPLPAGRVEKEIEDLHTDELMAKVLEMFSAVAADNDVVVVEAMGHVAMGSCLGLSAADVASRLGARALLVSSGGIGRAIDEVSLCATFLKARGADLIGVVVNKVWPEKYDRVKHATTKGLAHLGLRSYGTVQYEPQLARPTMEQVFSRIGGELLGGGEHMEHRIRHTIVAAMEVDNMIRHVQPDTLVITPGDRTDNILAALSTHMIGESGGPVVAGMVLTGDIRPAETLLGMIHDSHLPIVLVAEDTYHAASRLKAAIFKITPDDHERFDCAVNMVADYVDVEGILETLTE